VRDSEAVETARRELGAELAAYRRAAGHSQVAFASMIAYSRSTVANVETGHQHVARGFWERADEVLGARGALTKAHDEVEAIARRERQAAVRAARDARAARGEHLQTAQANDLAQPLSGRSAWPQTIGDGQSLIAALERGRTADPRRGADGPEALARQISELVTFPLSGGAMSAERALDVNDPQAIAFLSDALPCYARTASMLGGRPLIEVTERYIRLIYSGCAEARGNHRNKVLNICARYAEFLGWLHQDLGNPVYSLFWTDRALEWVQEADTDPQFLSYVLMRKSDHAEQYGTADRVVSLARVALKVPALSPRAKALAIQQEARGHSQLGDRACFERRLDEAREYVLQAESSRDAMWGEYCNLTHIAMQEASGWIELGQFEKAIGIMEHELPRMPSVNRVDSTVFGARLARAYAEAGYVDRAAQTALETCNGIQATASIRALTELSHVRRILHGHGDSPAIASFISTFDSLTCEFPTTTRQAQ
jgi:hypothetical protein